MGVFKDRLKEARKDKGLTQLDLANILNVKQATISSWEQGKTEPSFDILCKIANCLGVTTDFLLGID